ncbi:hypothetical protein VTO73DRAFT_13202 [Trametes versicolor]
MALAGSGYVCGVTPSKAA